MNLKGIGFYFMAVALMLHFTTAPAAAERVIRRAITKQTGCSSIIPIGRVIWKGCAASGHLSGDPRQKGVALIAPRGVTLSPPSCVPILDSQYKKIGALQMYPGNDGRVYKWRAYSNFGCGAGITQTNLRTKSKGKEIYLQVGRGQCIKINKSFSNVNSAQKC